MTNSVKSLTAASRRHGTQNCSSLCTILLLFNGKATYIHVVLAYKSKLMIIRMPGYAHFFQTFSEDNISI